ncbi:ABC transporter permease [Nocardiopsis protaetiae]|uniref:ABC transporter permease n=1 Tax=Nocardiopsis protaetiae TaxID=3382270 RepID=UPI00387B8F29
MNATATPTAVSVPDVRVRRRRGSGLGPGGLLSAGLLGAVLLLAVFGPLIAPQDPDALNLSQAYAGPSAAHPLGQDGNGRDLLSRLIVGAGTALIGPLLVVLAATAAGTALALAAVWYGGWFDAALAWVVDAVFAFPGLLLAILATALFGPGLPAAVVALAIAYIPYMARIVRGAALRERALPYVAALRTQGVRPVLICLRHILPNVAPLIVANATVSFGFAVIDLAALSFIGLGVQIPDADWGAMVGGGLTGILQNHPQESLYAGALIVATVAAANLLGDRITERSEGRV